MAAEHRSRDCIAQKNEPEKPKSEIHKKIEKFMGEKFEVHLTDGRLIQGIMIATDRDANMIFVRADERWSSNPTGKPRQLGQAMISKKYVKSMRFLTPPKESEL